MLLIIAASLRFYSIEALPLWLDEAYTYRFSKLPLSNLLTTAVDVSPPLFYIVEKISLLFGHSELVLRFAPAVFGVAAVCMIHLIGRRFVSPVCGLTAAAVLATSTVHIRYSQEARSYTLLFLEITIAAYGVLKFIENRQHARPEHGADKALNLNAILIYIFGAITALYTHNTSVFYLFALNLTVLLAWRPLKYIDNRMLIHWLVAQAALLVIWLPWLVVVFDQAQSDVFSWLAHRSLRGALKTIMDVYGFSHVRLFGPVPGFFVICLIVAGIVGSYDRHFRAPAVLAGLFVIMVPSVMWAIGFLKPIFMLRTVLACLIGSSLGLGLAVAFAPARLVAYCLLTFVIVGNVTSTINYFEYRAKPNWNDVARVVSSDTKKGDLVILCEYYTYLPFNYYFEKSDTEPSFAGWLSKEGFLFEINSSFMEKYLGDSMLYRRSLTEEDFADRYGVNMIADFGGSYRRIWVIKSHCRGIPKELSARIRKAGFIIQSEDQYIGIDITVFGPP